MIATVLVGLVLILHVSNQFVIVFTAFCRILAALFRFIDVAAMAVSSAKSATEVLSGSWGRSAV
jgi:hypothetical protein